MNRNPNDPTNPIAKPGVEVVTLGELRRRDREDYIKIGYLDGVDETVTIWVEDAFYLVGVLSHGPDDHKTDLMHFDCTGMGSWAVAFRDAMAFATELLIADTRLALGEPLVN